MKSIIMNFVLVFLRKKNLFYFFLFFIDSESCTNIRESNLNTIKHHRTYRFQWLNKYGEVKVRKDVFVSFVLLVSIMMSFCVIWFLYMRATCYILKRLWQFDRNLICNGFIKKYTLAKDEKPIKLIPLSPKQVYKNQLKLKREGKARRSESTTKTVSLKRGKKGANKRENDRFRCFFYKLWLKNIYMFVSKTHSLLFFIELSWFI